MGNICELCTEKNRTELEKIIKKALPEDAKVYITYSGGPHAGVGNARAKVVWEVPYMTKTVHMYLSELPGQCGILMAHSLPNRYYEGNGTTIRTDLQAIAVAGAVGYYMDYGAIMITHIKTSSLLKVWKEHGWKEVSKVFNPHSLNTVSVCIKEL